MNSRGSEAIRAMFHTEVPDDLLTDTGRCLLAAYREAFNQVREEFPGEEARDLFPLLRRAMFERNWRTAMGRRKGVRADAVQNEAGNCFHTRVSIGRVVLTASAVETPEALVRDAIFRKTLAESNQPHLFRGRSVPPKDAMLYGIVLHGPAGAGLLPAPMFLRVSFPSMDLDEYGATVDLIQHLPELAAELHATPSEPTVGRVRPTLREIALTSGEHD